MSADELTAAAMALPLAERIALAQALLKSIDDGPLDIPEEEIIREALRRSEELSSGVAIGRTHAEVMEAAHRAIRRG